MRDIVEEALENAAEDGEATDREPDGSNEFGRPKFAFVGCGEAGVARVNEGVCPRPSGGPFDPIEFDVTTVAVESADLAGDDRRSLVAQLEATDLAVVTAHLRDARTTDLTTAAAECLPEDATVVAVVSVPEPAPDTDDFSTAFSGLVNVADTTVPIDLGRIRGGFGATLGQSADTPEKPSHDLVDDLVHELTTDVFEMAHAPLAAPLNVADFYDLLDTGGIALTYRGWGTRDDVAGELLDHAVAHRLCDGNAESADGGLGFCRFGSEFLLSDYEDLFEEAADRFVGAVESNRWLDAGNSIAGLDEECRLTLALTGIDPSSLAFFDPE